MSKLLLPVIGVGGASAVAIGGYVFFKGKSNSTTKQEETFRSKYSKAILEKGSNLWEAKFTDLKKGQPAHPTLLDAKSKSSSNGVEAKNLHQKGCEEIYDSKFEGTTYLDDFQLYCSKNLKDKIVTPKTWISDANTEGGKWNTKLNNLKEHDPTTNKELDNKLSTLKDTLSKISNSSWTNEHRKILKEWCEASQKSIFMGDKDPKFIHSGLYCVEG